MLAIRYYIKRRMDSGYSFLGFSSNDFPWSSKNASFELQIKWQISFFKKCLLAFSCGHSTRICLCIKKGCAIIHTGKRTKIVTKWSYRYCNIFERASFFVFNWCSTKSTSKALQAQRKRKFSHTQLMNSFPFLYNKKYSYKNYFLF